MKDTITKLRNLLDIKSKLLQTINDDLTHARLTCEALRADLEHAVRIIKDRDRKIERLEQQKLDWWIQQDQDEEWLAEYLAHESRMERDTEGEYAVLRQVGVEIDDEGTLHAGHSSEVI